MMVASVQRHIAPGLLRFPRPQGGLYLWCRIPTGISSRALLDNAVAAGVAFVAGHAFYADPAGESELRICFSSVIPDAIDQAVIRLSRTLSEAVSGARQQRRLATSA